MRALRDRTKRTPRDGSAISLAAVLLVASLSTRSAFAQARPAEPQKNTISGTVVNAITRAPIPRALVSSSDNRYAMLTDSAGHFEFNIGKESDEAFQLPHGGMIMTRAAGDNIWLTARRPGFLTEGESGAMASP